MDARKQTDMMPVLEVEKEVKTGNLSEVDAEVRLADVKRERLETEDPEQESVEEEIDDDNDNLEDGELGDDLDEESFDDDFDEENFDDDFDDDFEEDSEYDEDDLTGDDQVESF